MKKSVSRGTYIDRLDALFVISSAVDDEKGEDSFCCSCKEYASLIGVFDGAGGLGSRQYSNYENHTGAYIASRLVSGAVYDWFLEWDEKKKSINEQDELRTRICDALKLGKEKGGETLKLRGSMVRDFPTTAAIVLARQQEKEILIKTIWAGDSRIYFLDQSGLSQFTKDDTGGGDAFEDLRNDPVQTNILSSDGNFDLHQKTVYIDNPIIIIAASDGYFGYWPTPMDFEYFLLRTLERAGSLYEWKQKLHDEILEVTGDDATLGMMLFYFGTFQKVKDIFSRRLTFLESHFIQPLSELYTEEKARQLWLEYKDSYNKYLK